MEISERIKLIISDKNLSIRGFSKSIGFADTTIGNVILGKSEPGYKLLYAICSVYSDISPEWLITGNGEMYRADEEKIMSKTTLISSELLMEAQNQSKELLNMLKQSQAQLDNLMKMYSDLVSKQTPGNDVHLDNGVKCAGAK